MFSLFIALIFLFSFYGPRPFSLLGPWESDLGKFYTRRKTISEISDFSRSLVGCGFYVAAGTASCDFAYSR